MMQRTIRRHSVKPLLPAIQPLKETLEHAVSRSLGRDEYSQSLKDQLPASHLPYPATGHRSVVSTSVGITPQLQPDLPGIVTPTRSMYWPFTERGNIPQQCLPPQ